MNEFEELIWEFINDNVTTSCKMCHEQGVDLQPDDWKPYGSTEPSKYDLALTKLMKDLEMFFKR